MRDLAGVSSVQRVLKDQATQTLLVRALEKKWQPASGSEDRSPDEAVPERTDKRQRVVELTETLDHCRRTDGRRSTERNQRGKEREGNAGEEHESRRHVVVADRPNTRFTQPRCSQV